MPEANGTDVGRYIRDVKEDNEWHRGRYIRWDI